MLRDGLTSWGAAPPRLPALPFAAIIQPLRDAKRCCCLSACSYTFEFGFRRNVLIMASFFFCRKPRSTSAAPTGPAAVPIDRGWGRACPSRRLRPVLTDRSGQRGPGWEATAAGGEREGATAGASPGLTLLPGRASPQHPPGTGEAAAPPRRGVGLGTMPHGEYSLMLNYGQYLGR